MTCVSFGAGVTFSMPMDYDQSIQLHFDVSVKDCRRPSNEAQMGWDLYKPLDVWLGESQPASTTRSPSTLGRSEICSGCIFG